MQRKTERKKIFKLKENLSNIIKNGFKYIRDHLSFYSNTPDISNSVGYQEQQEYSPIKKESKNIQKEYFYAVNNSRIYDETRLKLFTNLQDALSLCKKDPKNYRFKRFDCLTEAHKFTIEQEKPHLNEFILNSVNSPPSFVLPTYKTISVYVQNELCNLIESDKLDEIKSKILSNPRYLISIYSDAPVKIKKAFNYNCLHICAKENRTRIAQFILATICDADYVRKLFPQDTDEQIYRRIEKITESYLNMPEKGLNETPLHFACKYGNYDIVKLFLSFNSCSKIAPNKHGKTPYELICTKSNNNSSISQIRSLFDDHYYVPFLCQIDNLNVTIEEPITIELLDRIKSESNLIGYIGPSSHERCLKIYEILKANGQQRNTNNEMDKLKNFKNLASILSKNYEIPFMDYWPTINCFININSNEGLQKLDEYLCNRTSRPDNFKKNYETDKKIYFAIRNIPINYKLFPTLYEFKNSNFYYS